MPSDNSSSFRRFGQRDDRRRRLLTDDLSDGGGVSTCYAWPGDAPPQKSEHYGDAEFLEQRLRLLDLIPRRMVSLVLALIAATAILAGLEVSYAWMLDHAPEGPMATALDLTAKGSLVCWFSSLMLLAASATAVVVYSVRRHRTDDYQGRYRIWLWAAACCFLMATDEAASLREGLRDLMIGLTGTPLVDDGTLWWAVPYAFAWGAVGSRLLIDMRSDRLSVGALLVAAVTHMLAIAGWLGWIFPQGNSRDMMFLVGFEMAGNLALLAAMTLYARHVILDAEGLLPRRVLRLDEELIDEESMASTAKSAPPARNRWRKIDPPHTAGQPAFQRVATSTTTASVSRAPVQRKLTKAERKALKQRLLRERLERQRQGL